MVSGHSQISRREKCDRIQVNDSKHRWQVGDWMSRAQCLGVSWGIQCYWGAREARLDRGL